MIVKNVKTSTTEEAYEGLFKIGQGSYGKVYKSTCKTSKKQVALKKIFIRNGKLHTTSYREIILLDRIRHENIVRILDISISRASECNGGKLKIYMVMEFCEHDLYGILSNKSLTFKLEEKKTILKQILSGLFYIHCHKVVHRDLKPSNVLVTKNGIVKIADFGLATMCFKRPLTPHVVTLRYRAPEVILGDRHYGPAIDMWSLGCIMVQLWTRFPIMKGINEQEHLKEICAWCGTINDRVWPDVSKLPLYNALQLPPQESTLSERLRPIINDHQAIDLLGKLLTLDPKKRIDADNALDHDFFWNDPLPVELLAVLSTQTRSMFEMEARIQNKCKLHFPDQSSTPNQNQPTNNSKNHQLCTRQQN